jgi:LysR family glycine cleavage system transcriptional activator
MAETKGLSSPMMKKAHQSQRPAALRGLPPLTALAAFERAAAELSFRRAARALALSPSAVSHQIRGLEEHFGLRLFTRAGRAVQLTADGETYLQSVRAALALLESANRDMLRRGRGGPAELRVSALPFFTSAVIIPRLADFQRRHPELAIQIEGTHRYADFDASGVDVAIRYGREHATGLRLEPLVDVASLPVCAPALLPTGVMTPPDLVGQVLIHVTAQPRAWGAWLKDAGLASLEPRGELWFDAVPAALEAAEQGLGVALAMHPLIKGWRGFGRTLVAPFAQPSSRTETLYFVSRPEQAHDRKVTAFRRWLIEAVKDVAGG